MRIVKIAGTVTIIITLFTIIAEFPIIAMECARARARVCTWRSRAAWRIKLSERYSVQEAAIMSTRVYHRHLYVCVFGEIDRWRDRENARARVREREISFRQIIKFKRSFNVIKCYADNL